jgi:hypothetical protein
MPDDYGQSRYSARRIRRMPVPEPGPIRDRDDTEYDDTFDWQTDPAREAVRRQTPSLYKMSKMRQQQPMAQMERPPYHPALRERPPYNTPFDYRGQASGTYARGAGRLAQRSIDDANRSSDEDYDYYRKGGY